MLASLRAYRAVPASLAVVLVLGLTLPLAWAVCAHAMMPGDAPVGHPMAAHTAMLPEADATAEPCHEAPPPPCHPAPSDADTPLDCCVLGAAPIPAEAMVAEAPAAPIAGVAAAPAAVRSLSAPPSPLRGPAPAETAPPGVARHLLLSVFLT